MSEHELTEEKVGELFDEIHQPPPYSNWDCLSSREVSRELEFARSAYDLGKQAATAQPGTGWTDDELRTAIDKAERPSVAVILRTNVPNIRTYHLDSLRAILTALGIDHQPKPELPEEIGSIIYDVELKGQHRVAVMRRTPGETWSGVSASGVLVVIKPGDITSFGGVLDLDKVRGEQA